MKTYTLRDARRIVAKAQKAGFNGYVRTSDASGQRNVGRCERSVLYVPLTRDAGERGYLPLNTTLPELAAWLDNQIRIEGGSSPALLLDEEEDNNEQPSEGQDGDGGNNNDGVTSEGSGSMTLPDLDSTWNRSRPAAGSGTKGAETNNGHGAGNSTGGGAGMLGTSARTQTTETSPATGKPTGQASNAAGCQDFTPHHADNAEGSRMRENAVACGSGTAGHGEVKSWPSFNLNSPGGDLTGDILADLPHSDGQYSHSANGGRASSVIDERAVEEAARAHKGSAAQLSSALDSLFKRLQEVGNGMEQSPRIDSAKLVRELVSHSVRMSQTRREEMSRRLTVITVDVSPSCSEIAPTATAAGIALCQMDHSVVLITHSNGYIESISGHRKNELNMRPGQDDAEDGYVSEWRKFTPDKVAGIVVWGDYDAIEHYAVAAERVPLFWLDPQSESNDKPWDDYPHIKGLKSVKTYIRGVDAPEKAPHAIRKCKF